MRTPKEINALIRLLDDPDEDIYGHIKEELKSFGSDVIPNLESHWEKNRLGNLFQHRIENLIHEIQYGSLEDNLVQWWHSDKPDLLDGVTLVSNYKYPTLSIDYINDQITKYTQEIWLEINDYLTALEKIKLINHFIFEVHGFSGNVAGFHDNQNSFLKDVLDSKKGNPLSLSILYILIGRQLDLPIYGVNLPRHFVVAYLDPYRLTNPIEDSPVLFYINPFSNGDVFGPSELSSFLEKINVKEKDEYFKPCDSKVILKRMLNNLIYAYTKSEDIQKAEEIKRLSNLLK
ncbi:transglutaminase family protein [bacterium SCSIO 12643]|nr:transglutaminase family protein [bacterium SCSIO 12643]